MAFTKNPVSSTYDTKRLDFAISPQQRSGQLPNKDARMLNMMIEPLQAMTNANKRLFVKSRPGLDTAYSINTGIARGVYYWVINNVGYVITVCADKVYTDGVLVATLTTTTGEVGFTEFVSSTGTVTLVMVDGTKGYVFTNAVTAPTEITAVDFPTPHIPQPVFLDGYLFLAKQNTQDIYNSNLDDPALWTSGDYISAEMYPDTIVALSKNNNYIYAVGRTSLEYFFDEANATGSPLGRHDSAVQQFGTSAGGTVVGTDNEVILVGGTANGGYTVWTIAGFKEKEISIPAIRSILLAEGDALATAVAHCVRVGSQKLYVVTLTSRTIVYSFDNEMWSEWASGVDGTAAFIGSHATNGPNGAAYVLDRQGSKVYKMSEDYFTDAGTAFLCQITTPKQDFDTFNQKFMSRLSLIGDVPDDTGVDNNVTVQWSDDDYKTWSPARTISFNYGFPSIPQLGVFRRRAFRFQYILPHLLRLEGYEVDINKGSL
tara:strand:- start:439 stop:1899 length:1461 start_codon:yes stop_codon:yes gene_type:complete